MQLDELRSVLRAHFAKTLDAHKKAIRRGEILSPVVVASFEATVKDGIAPQSRSFKQADDRHSLDRFELQRILADAGMQEPLPEAEVRSYVSEYRRADVAHAKAVLAFQAEDAGYDFTAEQPPQAVKRNEEAIPGDTLEEVVSEFLKFAKLENRWSSKTEGERAEHIALLFEAFGSEIAASTVGHSHARRMRDILTRYPPHRTKKAVTRGKTLDEVLAIPGLDTLHPRTINKYMQTYNSLFDWAHRNGYCSLNPFGGMGLRTEKANKADPRVSFSDAQLRTILQSLLSPTEPKAAHHKWGTLIAMHSGARLNEVAQLHLEDIQTVDGVQCFNINQDGERKRLKNAASKRIIPVHPLLLEYGFKEYVTKVSAVRGNKRLFPQLTFSQSDGYGRNLGRWVNETLLPDLNIKTKQLTFHSFRHTMVRKLIASNATQEHIMAIVGHEPGTTTLNTYNRQGFPPRQLLAALEAAFAERP